jgi:hypothetical protein
MKKSTIVSALMLIVTGIMLSGCIFPYWDDEGRGHGGGHGHYEGHHDEGRH